MLKAVASKVVTQRQSIETLVCTLSKTARFPFRKYDDKLTTETTIKPEALLTRPDWSFGSNTLCRHVNDYENVDYTCFDYVAIESQGC